MDNIIVISQNLKLESLASIKTELVSGSVLIVSTQFIFENEREIINKAIGVKCEYVDFADLLCRYKQPIINSFVMVEKYGSGGIYDSRLSNGPIESLNRKVKDLKRLGRGFRSFEHFRNRFLYATRNNPVLDGVADRVQVQYFMEEDYE